MDTTILLSLVRLSFITSGLYQGGEFRTVLHGIGISGGPTSAHREMLATAPGAWSHPAQQSLVLDCVYDLVTLSPAKASSNLNSMITSNNLTKRTSNGRPKPDTTVVDFVVKWFRNDEPAPLYTWIPAIGQRLFHHAYRDLVDPLYKHNDANWEMFRAVRIIRPITALSGNFRCEIEMAGVENGTDVKIDGAPREDEVGVILQTSNRTLYFYDPPTHFDMRLNLSSRHIRCVARTSEQPLSSVAMAIYLVNYDAFEMPSEKITLFNTTQGSTTRVESNRGSMSKRNMTHRSTSFRNTSSPHEAIVELDATLATEDLKVNSEGWSRDFVCELVYNRVQTPERLMFQRSIRLIHEAREIDNAMNNLYEELPEAGGWYARSSSSTQCKLQQLALRVIVISQLYLLYNKEALRLP